MRTIFDKRYIFLTNSHIYHHNIRNTTLHTIFHVLFLFICLNFSNKSKIKCATNAAAISGGMSHTMFPVIFVSILLYNLQKMFFSTFQQISMSNSHRTSCEFLKDIFGRISGADSGARWSPSRIESMEVCWEAPQVPVCFHLIR